MRLKSLLLGSSIAVLVGPAAMAMVPAPMPPNPMLHMSFGFEIYGGNAINLVYDVGGLGLAVLGGNLDHMLGDGGSAGGPILEGYVDHGAVTIGDPAMKSWDDHIGGIYGITLDLSRAGDVRTTVLIDLDDARMAFPFDDDRRGSPPVDLGVNVAILADHRHRFGRRSHGTYHRQLRMSDGSPPVDYATLIAGARNDNHVGQRRRYG
jgi:hypothetical protein